MKHPHHPSNQELPLDSDAQELGPAEDWIRAWRQTLRPGGPDVDPVAIMAYVDKTLPSGDAQYVQKLIQTFEAWSAMFWEIQIAVLDSQILPAADHVGTTGPLPTHREHATVVTPGNEHNTM